MQLSNIIIDEIVIRALQEDIGTGDLTTLSVVPKGFKARAVIHAKEKGILAGIGVASRVFSILSQDVVFTPCREDGQEVGPGEVIAQIDGPASVILSGERVALNLLQRMSGVATKTRKVAELLKDFNTVIVDTRKTTPGLRVLEKYAVRAGGGQNHRFGLYDGVLIKDNHIKVAGGIKQAVSLARQRVPHTVRIEVEVETIGQVQEALEAGADIIMLDNMDIDTMKKAKEIIGNRALVEISGGVKEEDLPVLGKLGVDIISMGSLTHSVNALDISLDIGEIKKS